jgi:hypothetical protein
MQHLEGNSTLVLYIGRTVFKGECVASKKKSERMKLMKYIAILVDCQHSTL